MNLVDGDLVYFDVRFLFTAYNSFFFIFFRFENKYGPLTVFLVAKTLKYNEIVAIRNVVLCQTDSIVVYLKPQRKSGSAFGAFKFRPIV